MFSLKSSIHALALSILALSLTACKNGGEVSLESGARKVASQGSPFVQVNQGGQAMIVEQGKTPTTGVHGFVSIQTVTSSHLTNISNGNVMVLNRNQVVH